MSKNKKKKIIIFGLIIFLLIVVMIYLMFNKVKLDNKSSNNRRDSIKKEIKLKDKDEDKTKMSEKEVENKNYEEKEKQEGEESTIKEDNNVNSKQQTTSNNSQKASNNKANNNNTNNNQNNNNNQNAESSTQQIQPVTPPQTSQPVYSCPADYILNGTQCISSYTATFVCPEGTYDFSDGNVNGCVNLSEGFYTDEETCPAGYGGLSIISFGAADRYKCLPIYSKVLVCEDGYSLQGLTCIKTIPASQN